jgi:hypothetical protein
MVIRAMGLPPTALTFSLTLLINLGRERVVLSTTADLIDQQEPDGADSCSRIRFNYGAQSVPLL